MASEELRQRLLDSVCVATEQIAATFDQNMDGGLELIPGQLIREDVITPWQARQLAARNGKRLQIGAYDRLDRIGAGGMGEVFRARHRRMMRIVALKTLPAHTMESADAVQRFEREVEAAARLIHPNIVTAYDAGEDDGHGRPPTESD